MIEIPNYIINLTEKHKIYKAYKIPRKTSDITAIVLHQTACHLRNQPERWYQVPSHFGITQQGDIFWINKFETVCWHANYFNRFSVGIEIDGNFRGIADDENTLWRPGGSRSVLTPEQSVAAKKCIGWIMEICSNCTLILAHRQTNENRRADPGEEIWREIGLWSQENFGLENDPEYTKGSGLPIPKQWDSRSEHAY